MSMDSGPSQGKPGGSLHAWLNLNKAIHQAMTKSLEVISEAIRNPKHPFRKVDNQPKKPLKHRYERRKIDPTCISGIGCQGKLPNDPYLLSLEKKSHACAWLFFSLHQQHLARTLDSAIEPPLIMRRQASVLARQDAALVGHKLP